MTKRQDIQTPVGRIDSSYIKLRWNVQDIFEKVHLIQDELSRKLKEIPSNNTKEIRKINNWQNQINDVVQKMENIAEIKIIDLEKQLHYKFESPELVILSLFQPSMNKFFSRTENFL